MKCGAIVRLSSRVGDRPTKLSQFPRWANFLGSSWLLLWEIGQHHPNTLHSSALDTDTDRRPGQRPRPRPKRVALQHSSHTDKHGRNARYRDSQSRMIAQPSCRQSSNWSSAAGSSQFSLW